MRLETEALGITLNLEIKGDFTLILDKLRIQQILINLLKNSIKFSKAKDVINVVVHASRDF